ncbi:hypothetical protein [Zooshikella harenae]|uniref:SPOR domain-containing protein n=1 Tax=Zooshikella harenae TaxID=2827238 RepID=A0ABS5ZGJ5_9GAMM|nr:hypothetical protein [Zooshikella harenae]MBU2712107.1 hypothetical protein [Zooshikella harenae]
MRWIFLTLLLANGFLYGYFWYQGNHSNPVQVEPEVVETFSEGKGIQLLTEVNPTKLEKLDQNNTTVAVPQKTPHEPERFCIGLGPFTEVAPFKEVQQRFFALGVQPDVEKQHIETEPDYWVYIPPQPSRKYALRKLKELKEQNIDSYIINDGELKNGISLGLFTKKASADKLHKTIAQAGYNVKVKRVERFKDEIWLVFAPDQVDLVGDKIWVEIAKKYHYIEKRRNRCKPIASYINIP